MIGKSLRERYTLAPLAPDRAVAVMQEELASSAQHLVQVRSQDARMIACVVVRADEASVRFCKTLGFRIKRGGTGVFGLFGEDAARLFGELTEQQRAWLEAPCGPRQTKVLLIAGGTALLSLDVDGSKVDISAIVS